MSSNPRLQGTRQYVGVIIVAWVLACGFQVADALIRPSWMKSCAVSLARKQLKVFEYYITESGVGKSYGLQCPDYAWLRALAARSPSGEKVFMDIGSNKGHVSMLLLQLWAPQLQLSHQDLYELHKRMGRADCGACMECHWGPNTTTAEGTPQASNDQASVALLHSLPDGQTPAAGAVSLNGGVQNGDEYSSVADLHFVTNLHNVADQHSLVSLGGISHGSHLINQGMVLQAAAPAPGWLKAIQDAGDGVKVNNASVTSTETSTTVSSRLLQRHRHHDSHEKKQSSDVSELEGTIHSVTQHRKEKQKKDAKDKTVKRTSTEKQGMQEQKTKQERQERKAKQDEQARKSKQDRQESRAKQDKQGSHAAQEKHERKSKQDREQRKSMQDRQDKKWKWDRQETNYKQDRQERKVKRGRQDRKSKRDSMRQQSIAKQKINNVLKRPEQDPVPQQTALGSTAQQPRWSKQHSKGSNTAVAYSEWASRSSQVQQEQKASMPNGQHHGKRSHSKQSGGSKQPGTSQRQESHAREYKFGTSDLVLPVSVSQANQTSGVWAMPRSTEVGRHRQHEYRHRHRHQRTGYDVNAAVHGDVPVDISLPTGSKGDRTAGIAFGMPRSSDVGNGVAYSQDIGSDLSRSWGVWGDASRSGDVGSKASRSGGVFKDFGGVQSAGKTAGGKKHGSGGGDAAGFHGAGAGVGGSAGAHAHAGDRAGAGTGDTAGLQMLPAGVFGTRSSKPGAAGSAGSRVAGGRSSGVHGAAGTAAVVDGLVIAEGGIVIPSGVTHGAMSGLNGVSSGASNSGRGNGASSGVSKLGGEKGASHGVSKSGGVKGVSSGVSKPGGVHKKQKKTSHHNGKEPAVHSNANNPSSGISAVTTVPVADALTSSNVHRATPIPAEASWKKTGRPKSTNPAKAGGRKKPPLTSRLLLQESDAYQSSSQHKHTESSHLFTHHSHSHITAASRHALHSHGKRSVHHLQPIHHSQPLRHSQPVDHFQPELRSKTQAQTAELSNQHHHSSHPSTTNPSSTNPSSTNPSTTNSFDSQPSNSQPSNSQPSNSQPHNFSQQASGSDHGFWNDVIRAREPTTIRLHSYDSAKFHATSLAAAKQHLLASKEEAAAGVEWHVHHMAVSDILGSVLADPGCVTEGCGVLQIGEQANGTLVGKKLEPVPATMVDEEVERLGMNRVDFLKVDTTGSELAVLIGARKTLLAGKIGLLLFDYGQPGIWQQKLVLRKALQLLARAGMSCYYVFDDVFFRLTGCWLEAYEIQAWSNILCVHHAHFLFPDIDAQSVAAQLQQHDWQQGPWTTSDGQFSLDVHA